MKKDLLEKSEDFNQTGEHTKVLCGASAYEKKFYLNEEFNSLPERIKQELQIMCVMFTEDVGGVLLLEFDEDGKLTLVTQADEGDLLYDDIGSELKIREIQNTKKELLESIELYYNALKELKEKQEQKKED